MRLTYSQRNHTHLLGVALVLACLMTVTILSSGPFGLAQAQVTTPSWTYTGNLNTVRFGHTATLLPNGKVLVAGGINWSDVTVTNTAELYDPATGKWSLTGSLNVPRYLFTATLLSNGKVLVAGGSVTGVTDTNTAELYDPATGAWSLTGNLNSTRFWHSATLLRNGKVLIVGGSDESSLLNTAELYEPETGAWSVTGSLNACCGRFSHTATLLQNGKVLVAGGTDDDSFGPSLNLTSTELYDPNTGAWSITGSLNTGRMRHTATILPNGNVLAAGGMDFPCPGGFCSSTVNDTAELYNPATGTWSYTGRLIRPRSDHTATLLPNGQVLVAGFDNNFLGTSLNSAELYDPATGTWSSTVNLNVGRSGHTATLLQNGKVLVVGGSYGSLLSTELYDSGASSTSNPIDDAQFFVRMQYLDFLGREPEPQGLQFYLDILNGCLPSDTECIKYTRGALSANFFRSPEFQRKGSYVMYFYMVSLGQRPVTPAELNDQTKIDRPHYGEFIADLQSISDPNDDPAIGEAKKVAFTDAWMQRTEMQNRYGALANAAFVQKLLDTAGVTLTNQSALVDDLNAGRKTRAQVLRAIAESPEVNNKFYKQAFVTMEYFGYLHRDPESCTGSADPANCGYIFHNSRFQLAADPDFLENTIVRGFIESPEYRQRFGQP